MGGGKGGAQGDAAYAGRLAGQDPSSVILADSVVEEPTPETPGSGGDEESGGDQNSEDGSRGEDQGCRGFIAEVSAPFVMVLPGVSGGLEMTVAVDPKTGTFFAFLGPAVIEGASVRGASVVAGDFSPGVQPLPSGITGKVSGGFQAVNLVPAGPSFNYHASLDGGTLSSVGGAFIGGASLSGSVGWSHNSPMPPIMTKALRRIVGCQ